MKSLYTLPFCLALGTLPLCAATYLEPTNQEVLIRTDQLPLDSDTMHWLSRQLVVIAERENPGTAEQMRANAQLIALAKRLNQDNKEADELNRKLKKQENYDKANSDTVAKATSRVWSLVRFLSSSEAGKEANLLANCIKDAMVVIDPAHPELANFRPDPERWGKTVAKLEKFRAHSIASNNDKRVTDEPVDPVASNDDRREERVFEDDPPERDDKDEKTNAVAKWHLLKSTITAPVTEYARVGDKDQYRDNVASVQVEIQPGRAGGDDDGFEIEASPGPRHGDRNLRGAAHHIKRALKRNWRDIPNAKIKLRFRNTLNNEHQDYLLANLTVLLDSSLAGVDYQNNVFPLTKINNESKFVREYDYWENLRLVVNEGKESILLAPKESEGDFRQLISLEKPDFFVKNQVILVDNLKEARQYTGKEQPEKIAEAMKLFAEFQEVAQARSSIGALSANKHVRDRMENILQLMPNHLSAKMILLQGGGSRPTKLESKYLAYELDDISKPVARMLDKLSKWDDNKSYLAENLDMQASAMEEKLKQIEDFVDSSDKAMFERVEDLVASMKLLSRAASRIKSSNESNSGYHKRLARNTFDEIKASYTTLDIQISTETGREKKNFDKGFKRDDFRR